MFTPDPDDLVDAWALWASEADDLLAVLGDADPENAIDLVALWGQAKRFPEHRLRDERFKALDARVEDCILAVAPRLGELLDPSGWERACRHLGDRIESADDMAGDDDVAAALELLTDLDDANCAVCVAQGHADVPPGLLAGLASCQERMELDAPVFAPHAGFAVAHLRQWRKDIFATAPGLATTVAPWQRIAARAGFRAALGG